MEHQGYNVDISYLNPVISDKTELKSFIDKEIITIQQSDLVVLNTTRSSSSLAQKGLISAILGKKIIVVTHAVSKEQKKETSPWVLWLANIIIESNDDLLIRELTAKPSIFCELIKTSHQGNSRVKGNYVYVAGPFKHKELDYRPLFESVIENSSFKTVDPCSDEYTGDFRDYVQTPEIVHSTVKGDLQALKKCSQVLLFLDKSSSGGSQESLLASLLNKSVITGFGNAQEVAWHTWLLNNRLSSLESKLTEKKATSLAEELFREYTLWIDYNF